MKRKNKKSILKAVSVLFCIAVLVCTIYPKNIMSSAEEIKIIKSMNNEPNYNPNPRKYLIFGFGEVSWIEVNGERKDISGRVQDFDLTISNSRSLFTPFYILWVLNPNTFKFYNKDNLPKPLCIEDFTGYICVSITPPPDNIRLPARYSYTIRGIAENIINC